MVDLIETFLAVLLPRWARHRKERQLLAPIEDVIRADENDVLR
jgi:hypothetical protein